MLNTTRQAVQRGLVDEQHFISKSVSYILALSLALSVLLSIFLILKGQ